MKKIIVSLLFVALSYPAFSVTQKELSDNKKLISSAKLLITIDQFNGATICGFTSHYLGDPKSGEQHSENAFNIGIKKGFSYSEVMTALALSMEIYTARSNAYIEGLIAGFKQNSTNGNYNSEFRKIAKNKLLKNWHESNNCINAKYGSKY
jgi:hypothetical protein